MWSCVGPMKVPPISATWPPPMSSFKVRPPTRPAASITTTDLPAAATLRAAVSPAMPAPTTTTSTFFRGRLCAAAWAGEAATAPAAAVAAPDLISVRRVTPTRGRLRRLLLQHADVVCQVLRRGLVDRHGDALQALGVDQRDVGLMLRVTQLRLNRE